MLRSTALLAAVLTLSASAAAQDCPTPGTGEPYRIQSVWTGYVVAPQGGADAAGTQMVSATLDYSDDMQAWLVEPSGDGTHVRFRNEANGLYLRVETGATGENAPVVQAALDAASPAFDWQLNPSPGLCRVLHRTTAKNLRIRGNRESPPGSQPIVVQTLNESASSQKWAFVPEGGVVAPQPPAGERLRDLALDNWGLRIGAAQRSRFWIRPDSAAYAAVYAREFNSLTPEGSMKWPDVQPSPGVFEWSVADRQVAFAEANGMTVHGHPLVWFRDADPSRSNHWLTDPQQAPCSEMETILREHITAIMTRYAAEVDVWDVVNEAVSSETGDYRADNRWYECLGVGTGGVPNYVRVAFEEAGRVRQAVGSTAPLLYNEIRAFNDNDLMQERVYDMIAQLQSEGIAVDGAGFQFHEDTSVNFPAWINYATRLTEELGLSIYVTEMDVTIPDESPGSLEAQAQVYAETMERFLHLPRRGDLTLWGFTDLHSWRNPNDDGDFLNPLIFDEQYEPKPAYTALQRVLAGGTARETDRNGLQRFEAEGHEAQRGARTEPFARDGNGQILGRVEGFRSGDYLKFARTALTGARSVRVAYASESPLTLELRVGGPTGDLLGTVALAATGNVETYAEVTADLAVTPPGTVDLYVVGTGGGGARLDWLAFSSMPVADEAGVDTPTFQVRSAGPNPSAGVVTVRFDLPQTTALAVHVFDALGREVLTVAPTTVAAGSDHALRLDLSSLPGGVYLYRLDAGAGLGVATGRLVLTGR